MMLLRQSRSLLPCNVYLDDFEEYDKPMLYIQADKSYFPTGEIVDVMISAYVQMDMDGNIDSRDDFDKHSMTETDIDYVIEEMRKFVGKHKIGIERLWDSCDDYDALDFIREVLENR